jgi:uncharacterized protein YyaL (SSP411 family)
LGEVFRTHREKVDQASEDLANAISSQAPSLDSAEIKGDNALRACFEWAKESFDPSAGGFGSAPKFPRPAILQFLLRYGRRSGDSNATEMVAKTLTHMARGGIRDHIGGGFHRYSVDSRWRIPHFEKMLYDNAQLALTYLEAYQATKETLFSSVGGEILDYVEREMTGDEGGFFSATDADSEGEEGKFFVWSRKEIIELLGERDGTRFSDFYGVTEEGNFEGTNVLHASGEPDEDLIRSCEKLYEARRRRIHPLTDDKILTSWNGLAIAAFARGAFLLDRPQYAECASRAALFILEKLRVGGRLHRSYRAGRAQVPGFLDDHAFLAFGLLELFESTGRVEWFQEAKRLMDELIERFWDPSEGGFFMTSGAHEKLLMREKPYYDGAEPSGNAVAALNLLRLEAFTSDSKYGRYANGIFQAFGDVLKHIPHAAPLLLCALDYRLDDAKEIAIILDRPEERNSALVDLLRHTFLPNRVWVVAAEADVDSKLGSWIPFVKGKRTIAGRPTAYVCRRQGCEAPTEDPEKFAEQISQVKAL